MTDTPRAGFDWKSSLPYLLPFALFMAFTAGAEPFAGRWYPIVYALKIAVVAVVLLVFWKRFDELRGCHDWKAIGLGAVVGLAVFVEWVWIEGRGIIPPLPLTGSRAAFNPFEAIASDATRAVYIGVRMLGLAVVVPVLEELLWRSWLLRIIVREDFKNVPLGTFTWASCLISACLFALTHPEWFSALIAALAYSALLYRTKNLLACIVAHAVTNLALGIYVLLTGTWKLW